MSNLAKEKQIENKIKAELERRGAYFFKHAAGAKNKKGIPDVQCIYAGYGVVIEVKAPGGHVTPRQKEQIKKAADNGGVAIISSDVDFVIQVLDMLEHGVYISDESCTPFVNCGLDREPIVFSEEQVEGVWGDILTRRR